MGTDLSPRSTLLLPVKAQRLLRQIGDAIQLFFRIRKISADGVGSCVMILREINQIGDCFERIVDLMGDTGRQAAHCGNLLGSPESLLHSLPLSYIACHLRRADYVTVVVLDRRDGQGNIEPLTCLGDSHGLEVLYALTPF